jgi:hypothetical protein
MSTPRFSIYAANAPASIDPPGDPRPMAGTPGYAGFVESAANGLTCIPWHATETAATVALQLALAQRGEQRARDDRGRVLHAIGTRHPWAAGV